MLNGRRVLIMALRFLLDTDVLIWHLRGDEPTEELLKELEQEQPLGCSALSVFEVWSGVRAEEEEATHQFLSVLYKVPADGAIAFKAAEYWRKFRRRGITLGQADALIAATAYVSDLTLITYSRDHYPMEDIKLYEPMPPTA
jgi:predicted nucleic acid-binding protein